jgi:hypothetical protein
MSGAVESQEDFLRELKAGRFYPANGLLQDNLQPFTLASQLLTHA